MKIDTDSVKVDPGKTIGKTARGLEPHVDGFKNHSAASRVASSQGFGRAGSGPEAASGIDRGPFSSRTKLTSKP